MATLTVRNLDDVVVKRLRIRAAEHGRSAEAEHRAILRAVLLEEQSSGRQQVLERLAAFRGRTAGRGASAAAELLDATRGGRLATLTEASSQDGTKAG